LVTAVVKYGHQVHLAAMMGTVHNDQSVVDLVVRARSGDQIAWDQIVERYAPLVWAMCQRFHLSRADADDVGACVWLRLVERLDTIREPAALPGWLATTTRHECLRVVRVKGRETPVEDHERMVDATYPAADDWLLAQERLIALRTAFGGLSERCRQLLELLFADPVTPYDEVSAILDMPVGTIGPTRQRCLGKLRTSPALAALMDASTLDGR
jgi:RNA polymerase sigma factor (sigma-70 family)